MIQVFCTDKSHGKHVDINHYPQKAFISYKLVWLAEQIPMNTLNFTY